MAVAEQTAESAADRHCEKWKHGIEGAGLQVQAAHLSQIDIKPTEENPGDVSKAKITQGYGKHFFAGPLEKCAYQQRSACRNPELFLLWIRRLDFLQLVLYLFGSSARPEPEGQRLLCHASVSRNGGLLHSRRPAQRPPYSHPRAAARTLHSRRCRNSVRRRLSRSRSKSRKRARGQRCSSRRRRRAVPGPEFLLVRER